MLAAGSLAAIVTTGYLFHEATIFIEQGATAQDAARSLVPQMVGNAVGILVVSSLVDRRRMRGIVTISMVQLIFTLWWGFNLESFGPLWLFGLSFGLSTGLIFGYVLAALPRYFGTLHLGEIRGTFGAVTMMMASFGPLGFEMLQGVDTSVFIWVAAVAAALISLASLIIPWPEPMEDWTNTSQGPDLARQSSGPSE
jgi:MFS family permease